MKQVVLHVGLHKTGTTTIQRTLYAEKNNEILKRNGYLYPKSIPSNHSVVFYSNFCDQPEKYHMNVRKGYTLEEIEFWNNELLNKLNKEILENEKSNIILSGEGISKLNQENLEQLKEYLSKNITEKVRVIMYVRNPINWEKSASQERIKGGTNVKLNEPNHKFFKNNIQKFYNVFDQVNIFQFENAVKHDNGLVGHFLENIGAEEGIDEIKEYRSNDSISQVAADILSIANEREPLFINGKLNQKREKKDYKPLLKIKGPKFDIPYTKKIELFEVIKEDLKWLKDKTGIEYSISEIKSSNSVYNINSEIAEEILEIFLELTPFMRKMIIEFLKNQIKIEGPTKTLEDLLNDVLAEEKILDSEKKFKKKLGINSDIPLAVIYREIAQLLESHSQIDSAKEMMEIASKLRPQGQYIMSKLEEYKNVLKS